MYSKAVCQCLAQTCTSARCASSAPDHGWMPIAVAARLPTRFTSVTLWPSSRIRCCVTIPSAIPVLLRQSSSPQTVVLVDQAAKVALLTVPQLHCSRSHKSWTAVPSHCPCTHSRTVAMSRCRSDTSHMVLLYAISQRVSCSSPRFSEECKIVRGRLLNAVQDIGSFLAHVQQLPHCSSAHSSALVFQLGQGFCRRSPASRMVFSKVSHTSLASDEYPRAVLTITLPNKRMGSFSCSRRPTMRIMT